MPTGVDFRTQRLFVDAPLGEGTVVDLSDKQAHYLLTVLRMQSGSDLLVFNGRDGEWQAKVEKRSKKAGALSIQQQTRIQPQANDLWLLFAPIKRERMQLLVEKAVEMGTGYLMPVRTEHTQHSAVRSDKLRAIIIEAAEQCGVLAPPSLAEIRSLDDAISDLSEGNRTLVFCDERADLSETVDRLRTIRGRPIAVLIGPEGGFSAEERHRVTSLPGHVTLSLGPRILRAETAAVAALTLVQSVSGDWKDYLTTQHDSQA
ncbi:MAG: 16S rRNA (uracil(1498)-N(3))-methyltransferase [Pseudomonadota bacterium]